MPADTASPDKLKSVRCDDETWKRFRILALSQDVSLGRMLAELIDTYESA